MREVSVVETGVGVCGDWQATNDRASTMARTYSFDFMVPPGEGVGKRITIPRLRPEYKSIQDVSRARFWLQGKDPLLLGILKDEARMKT